MFKQRGVLRARNIHHYLKDDRSTPRFYTIKNDLVSRARERDVFSSRSSLQVFTVQFDEFVHGKWMPFNGTDVQLEFVRIDPFVRSTMKNKGKNESMLLARSPHVLLLSRSTRSPIPCSRHLRDLQVRDRLQSCWLHASLFRHPGNDSSSVRLSSFFTPTSGLCPSVASHRVRTIHHLGLSVLYLFVLDDGWCFPSQFHRALPS